MQEKDIKFIAKHYDDQAFSVKNGWLRLGIAAPSPWKRLKIAGVIAATVAMGATAAFFISEYSKEPVQQPQQIQSTAANPASVVKALDFDNAPLPTVIEEIRRVYGVDVTGIPTEAESYRLTLHYQGNAADLIDSINEILGTSLKISEP